MCAGASSFSNDGSPFQITLWGSEAGEDNGMAALEAFTWLAKSGRRCDLRCYGIIPSGSPHFVS